MSLAPLLADQPSIFGYLQKMNGLYFIPIFAVLLMGMFTRRVPAIAANSALVLGVVLISLGYFAVPKASLDAWFGHEFHFLGAVFLLLLVLMLLGGLILPDTTVRSAPRRRVDLTPWKPAWPVGIGLVAIILLIYILLADPSVLHTEPPSPNQ